MTTRTLLAIAVGLAYAALCALGTAIAIKLGGTP